MVKRSALATCSKTCFLPSHSSFIHVFLTRRLVETFFLSIIVLSPFYFAASDSRFSSFFTQLVFLLSVQYCSMCPQPQLSPVLSIPSTRLPPLRSELSISPWPGGQSPDLDMDAATTTMHHSHGSAQ